MICPRCGNQLDASKNACTNCGYVIRVAGQMGPITRNANPPQGGILSIQQSSGRMPSVNQPRSNEMPSSLSPNLDNSIRRVAPPTIPPRGPMRPASTPLPADSSFARSVFERNMLRKVPASREIDINTTLPQTEWPNTDILSLKNPQQTISGTPSTGYLVQNMSYAQSSAPVQTQTDGFGAKGLARDRGHIQAPPSFQRIPTTPAPSRPIPSPLTMRPLLPGVHLRGGRYRLQELRERQEWSAGVYEAIWMGQDSHRAGSQVVISEVVLPDNTSPATLAVLRTATMTLVSLGRHPHIPALWDAFSDQGRSFFVFEPTEGETLLSRMRRSGRELPEQDVIECCLQMTEVLELLAQQSPPLVHGLIRPEHIKVGRNGTQYVLTNFSIVLAGGATQFVTGIEHSHLTPYTPPEFDRGIIDVRTDLYSLIATAYHVMTGTVPTAVNGNIPSAQHISMNVSPEFDAILSKGLRPVANQRYSRPSELRQDLLAIRAINGSVVPGNNPFAPLNTPHPVFPGNTSLPFERRPAFSGNGTLVGEENTPHARMGQRTENTMQRVPDAVAEALPIMLAPSEEVEERPFLLPQPEELPPLKQINDKLTAAYWLGGILISLIILVVLSHVLG